MMKKVITIVLLAFLLVACGTSKSENMEEPNTSDKNNSSDAGKKENSSKELTLEDLEIKEYKEENDYATIYLLAIKNNSTLTVSISANATAYDEENNMIGASSGEIDVLGPGEESVIHLYFSGVTGVNHIEYKDSMQYSTDLWYQPVLSNLEVESAVNGNVAVFSIKNNGDVAAEFVEVYAIFMDADNNPLQISSTYIVDSNSEIAPGAKQSDQIEYFSPEEFDHVDWYLTGRADK